MLGGFPEVRTRGEPDRRDAWFRSYVSTLLEGVFQGREAVPFSDRVEALPISALWGLVARAGRGAPGVREDREQDGVAVDRPREL